MPEDKVNNKREAKRVNNDFFRALDECAEALSLDELSRISGVKIELLRRYVDRKVRTVRIETWDKIYPVLKPYLEGPVPPQEPPPRTGITSLCIDLKRGACLSVERPCCQFTEPLPGRACSS